MRDDDRSISMLEQNMARSRAEIDRTTDELKAKMEPENLVDAARQVIRDSSQRVEETVKNLGLADTATARVEDLGQQAASYLQQNPIPALIAGIGMGLLITLADREPSPHPTSQRHRPARIDQALSQHPRLREAQRKTVHQVRRANRQHPMMLGAAIFGTGLLLGTLLPTSRMEHEWLGPVRDQLLESGKETAEQAIGQVKDVVDHEIAKRKDEAVALAETAEETALRAYREARDENKTKLPAEID